MKINSLSAREALRALVSAPSGLTEGEAAKRLLEHGPNAIREARRTPLTTRFFRQFTHFLALLLWVAAALSFLSDLMHPGEGMATLGTAIVAVIVINAVFTFIQEYRAEKAFDALKRLLPFQVRVLREGRERAIPARELVAGDIIFLAEGDRVPADARLLESVGLRVDNASLTGESEPVLRDQHPTNLEFPESTNIVFAGTSVTSGSGKALVFATGMGTEFGRIAHLTGAVESGLSPLQKEIMKATRLVACIAALVGLFFFGLGLVIGRSFWENFIFAIGITVALIPEGLLPTVTLALAMASQRMAGRKALIKNLPSVETLSSVSVICTDKTGTLTINRMTAAMVWAEGTLAEAGSYRPTGESLLPKTAFFCNNAHFSTEGYAGDPTETALLGFARQKLGDLAAERLFEIPFDSERKRMTTIHRLDGRCFVFTKGAMETVLPLCGAFLSNGVPEKMRESFRQQVREACHAMMDKGLRVLAFACRELEGWDSAPLPEGEPVRADPATLETDLVFSGLIGLEDPPRPEVREAIANCHQAGIRVIMITGDGSRTAMAIARAIGLVRGEPMVVEGAEFTMMSDGELRNKLASPELLFARMTPKHKMRVVSLLQELGERVAVTGDGVNDAPALKKADIGISMGITGTDVAKEAADMILLDDNFATIVSAIEEGRAVYENIRKFITYIFASNIPEAVPYLSYILLGIPLPLTIIQILSVDLGTDMLPALALGAEKPTPGVMRRPPRSARERLINGGLIARAYLFLGVFEAAACMFGYFWVLYGGGWSWGTTLGPDSTLYNMATTACLTAIVITQVGNVLTCRTSRESVFRIGFFSNRLIFAGIGVELALQFFIVYHPLGNRIFATHPLSVSVWLVLLPFAVTLFFADEARKFLVRSWTERSFRGEVARG